MGIIKNIFFGIIYFIIIVATISSALAVVVNFPLNEENAIGLQFIQPLYRLGNDVYWNSTLNTNIGDGSLLENLPSPDLSGYIPYTGATINVDLGSNNLTTTWRWFTIRKFTFP